MPSPLGDKIRARREALGMSLDDLALKTQSSKSYLWDIENKDNPKPSADKVAKIAAALEVTTEYLMDQSALTPDEDVTDKAFFRKYQQMDAPTKKKLRKILDAWENEE